MAERTEGSAEAAGQEKAAEVTIKFGKGLIEPAPPTKNGREMVEIRIPNRDPNDRRPWESFTISPKMIHDNPFGKGVWMKLPEDGTTRLTSPVLKGRDEEGKNIWGHESRTVSNRELKSMLEAYRERPRDSVPGDLSGRKTGKADPAKAVPKREARSAPDVR